MLKEQRIKSGLGDPYYTNDVESQNRVIKHQMNYKNYLSSFEIIKKFKFNMVYGAGLSREVFLGFL